MFKHVGFAGLTNVGRPDFKGYRHIHAWPMVHVAPVRQHQLTRPVPVSALS
jgi:hypothetical protein